MDIDERHCPNCGHATLDWDVPCPGCDQIPWKTDAGWSVVRKRRFLQWLPVGGPILVIGLFILTLVVIGNVNLSKLVNDIRLPKESADFINSLKKIAVIHKDGLKLEARLQETEQGIRKFEKLKTSSRKWADDEIPHLIETIDDPGAHLRLQKTAALTLVLLFYPQAKLSTAVPRYHQKAMEILLEHSEHPNKAVRFGMKINHVLILVQGWLNQMDGSSINLKSMPTFFSAESFSRIMLNYKEPEISPLMTDRYVSLLDHSNERIGFAAALTLQYLDEAIGSKTDLVVPWLIERLRSDDHELVDASHLLLEIITREEFGKDQKAWKRWWNDHKDSYMKSDLTEGVRYGD